MNKSADIQMNSTTSNVILLINCSMKKKVLELNFSLIFFIQELVFMITFKDNLYRPSYKVVNQ